MKKLLTGFILFLCVSCADEHNFHILEEGMEIPVKSNILFGHQSVGQNIINGINDIIEIPIQEIDGSAEIDDFTIKKLYHVKIGKNKDPFSKMEDFVEIIEKVHNWNLDLAFMKFCYLDINSQTDIETLFNKYKIIFNELERKFPDVQFVHITVPLTTQEAFLKKILKLLIGRKIRGYEDNLAREKYNELLRKKYGTTGFLFDLAKIESESESGKRNLHYLHNQKYYSLQNTYTDDGGHLNEYGRRVIARELIKFLHNLNLCRNSF